MFEICSLLIKGGTYIKCVSDKRRICVLLKLRNSEI